VGLLAGALVGLWPEEALRPLTTRVLESLSVAEKAALQDQQLPFDADLVRRAAGLRWQVAAAVASAPQAGPVDEGAVKAILSGIDEVLAELKVASDGASPEVLRVVETVRHALVKEAIDLTELVQRLVPAGAGTEEAGPAAATPQRPRTPLERIRFDSPQAAGPRKGGGIWVALVLAVAAAGAYHGYRYVTRKPPAEITFPGAPSGTVAIQRGARRIVTIPVGKQVDRGEVEKYLAKERDRGNEVTEVAPGTWVIEPARAGKEQPK
jgi:hypothetical protein